LIILLYAPLSAFEQTKDTYPKNYFRWPLELKPAIVANLGELRPNHWHMGLDIRTNQKENQLVYAAAAGYIAKIRIESSGFGQCIWINHPNGLTTLYGHLNAFFPELAEYVKEQQYKQETWAIELDFPKEKFPVSKGQFIAYSGNTGGSQGPHLHFEIRDTKTDECINPLLFAMPLQDKVPPSILKLAIYDRSTSIYEQVTSFFPLRKTDNGYVVLNTPVIKTGLDKLSFAIQAFDRLRDPTMKMEFILPGYF
jgi:murein DD-endopeptidase MepM/ murein hydrolase activator NlpD